MVQLLATKMVTAAAIAGHDGNIWAQSAGFNVTPDEVKKVLGSWDNASAMGNQPGVAQALSLQRQLLKNNFYSYK